MEYAEAKKKCKEFGFDLGKYNFLLNAKKEYRVEIRNFEKLESLLCGKPKYETDAGNEEWRVEYFFILEDGTIHHAGDQQYDDTYGEEFREGKSLSESVPSQIIEETVYIVEVSSYKSSVWDESPEHVEVVINVVTPLGVEELKKVKLDLIKKIEDENNAGIIYRVAALLEKEI